MPYFALENEPLRLKNALLCDVVPNTSRLCDVPTRLWTRQDFALVRPVSGLGSVECSWHLC
jgi:hypothetical protein